VKRGEVWWVEFPRPVGRRPAVLVSRNEAYGIRSAITVVPLMRTIRDIPTEVLLGPYEGVPKKSVANADNVTTVAKVRLQQHLATLPAGRLSALDRAIKFALDLA
jgi:mRNA interferase MazF